MPILNADLVMTDRNKSVSFAGDQILENNEKSLGEKQSQEEAEAIFRSSLGDGEGLWRQIKRLENVQPVFVRLST